MANFIKEYGWHIGLIICAIAIGKLSFAIGLGVWDIATFVATRFPVKEVMNVR